MKTMATLFAAVTVAAGALLAPMPARAGGPVGIELGAKVGAGTNPVSGSGVNPMGFGIGGRGGVSLYGLYAGVAGVYYLGSSEGSAAFGQSGKTLFHSAVYGFEVGYSIKLSRRLTIRPQVGLGNDQISQSTSVTGMPGANQGSSGGYFYLEPAVIALFSIGILYVGADVGALLLPSGPPTSSESAANGTHSFDGGLTAHGQVGVSF